MRASIIWLVATIIGLAAVYFGAPQLAAAGMLPPVGSARAGEVDEVLMVFTLISVPVFMLVVIFGWYAVAHFRSDGQPVHDGPAMRGHRGTQIVWVATSIVLAVFLMFYGIHFLGEVQAAPPADALVVHVNGEQWIWNYNYPQYGNASTTTLYLPVGRPVRFDVTSTDVQHSFWIPALAVKQDAVPGEVTHISVTPSVVGDYEVRCAELCGVYHAYMETPVHVVSQQDFNSYMAALQNGQSVRVAGDSPVYALRDADRRTISVREG